MRLDFWFDLSCPYAYLASQRLSAAVRGRGAEVRYKPMLLGGVFRDTGAGDGPMATLSSAKRAHLAQDLARWAEVAGVPLRTPAAHPMRTVLALRTLLGVPEERWPAVTHELFVAYWQRGDDLTQEAEIDAALARAGVPADLRERALREAEAEPRKQDLRARTDEAVALGIFGAPAFVVHAAAAEGGPRLFWGQDRLAWVTAMLDGWRPPAPPPGVTATGSAPDLSPALAPARRRAVDFYFDVASPFAYLGLTQIARVTAGHTLRLRPILLGGLFRQIGTPDVPLLTFPLAKQRYIRAELDTWAAWWSQPFAFPTRFPQRTTWAQRLLLLTEAPDQQLALALALGRAMWAEGKLLEDEATLAGALDGVGAPRRLLEEAQRPAAKAALIDATSAAAAAGVFGVPTCVIAGEPQPALFWGQDRLPLVARALGAAG